jgi:hypothetical protein
VKQACGAKFFQAFCQVFRKYFACLSSFSKYIFGGFVGFQGVMGREFAFCRFLIFSKFLRRQAEQLNMRLFVAASRWDVSPLWRTEQTL